MEIAATQIADMLDLLESRYGRTRFMSRFDPLEELISCILSQSSSDASSFPAFTRLLSKFGDWRTIMDAPLEQVIEIIRPAGLANQKAKAIQGCLRQILERNGEFNLDNLRSMDVLAARSWLMQLPGVGPKTASIVLCFSFGFGTIPVDTHVFRVAHRIGLIDESIGERKAHDVLMELVSPADAFRFHTLLIQHGRHLCRSQKPDCESCPLKERCRYGSMNSTHAKKGNPKRIAPASRTN